MLRLGYRILTLFHLIDSLVAEVNVSLSAFARMFVYCSSSPSSRNSAPLTPTPSLPISHLMARAGSLAPPAGMSDNTGVTEYAVCDLRPSIPVITDGPDREISPSEFFEY